MYSSAIQENSFFVYDILVFFQNKRIFIQLDELDELDKITRA